MLFQTTRILACAILAITLFTAQSGHAQDPTPPNFLLLIGDDMGVETLSCYGVGTKTAHTPNIDRCAMKVFVSTTSGHSRSARRLARPCSPVSLAFATVLALPQRHQPGSSGWSPMMRADMQLSVHRVAAWGPEWALEWAPEWRWGPWGPEVRAPRTAPHYYPMHGPCCRH